MAAPIFAWGTNAQSAVSTTHVGTADQTSRWTADISAAFAHPTPPPGELRETQYWT